jgi:co-chaperonin GroES (HSP10)|tara:strand:+ start:2246 stop:2503 length:258 start_codon:yes stop_codon:yes gene_type:complete
MQAVNYYLVVEKIKEEPRTVGGLILTEKLDEENRYIKATVISKGNLVEGIDDKSIVYYDKHAGHGVRWKEKLLQVIKIQDVVLVE